MEAGRPKGFSAREIMDQIAAPAIWNDFAYAVSSMLDCQPSWRVRLRRREVVPGDRGLASRVNLASIPGVRVQLLSTAEDLKHVLDSVGAPAPSAKVCSLALPARSNGDLEGLLWVELSRSPKRQGTAGHGATVTFRLRPQSAT